MAIRIPHAIFNPASLYSRWHAAKDRHRILTGALAWWSMEHSEELMTKAVPGQREYVRPAAESVDINIAASAASRPRILVVQLDESAELADPRPGGFDDAYIEGDRLVVSTRILTEKSVDDSILVRCILMDSRCIERLAELMSMPFSTGASLRLDMPTKPTLDQVKQIVLAALDEDRLYTDLDVATTLAGLPDFDFVFKPEGPSMSNGSIRAEATISTDSPAHLPNDLIAILVFEPNKPVGGNR